MRTVRQLLLTGVVAGLAAVAGAAPALACAGLVTPGGNVRLVRTATLSAWADGYEHYVTSFVFEGGGAEVGSLVPLPGIPSKVERGGDWTLQRLERETQPPPPQAARAGGDEAAATSAEEVYNTRIDALDITILKGGGASVASWAEEHGFSLTPDAPEVLDFYAARSPVFMAARFNTEAAKERNQAEGEGTPIHLTIPLDEPWVPLRILGLGRQASEVIDADVYLLTPKRPNLLPKPTGGIVPVVSEAASESLLDDLRSDKGMEWVPSEMWLTYLRIGEEASDLRYDLAIDAAGDGAPSPVMAGLEAPPDPSTTTTTTATAPPPDPTTTTQVPAPKPKPNPTTTTTEAPAPATTVPPATGPAPEPAVLSDDSAPEPEASVQVALPARRDGRRSGLAVAGGLAGAGIGAGLTAWGVRARWFRRGSA